MKKSEEKSDEHSIRTEHNKKICSCKIRSLEDETTLRAYIRALPQVGYFKATPPPLRPRIHQHHKTVLSLTLGQRRWCHIPGVGSKPFIISADVVFDWYSRRIITEIIDWHRRAFVICIVLYCIVLYCIFVAWQDVVSEPLRLERQFNYSLHYSLFITSIYIAPLQVGLLRGLLYDNNNNNNKIISIEQE